MSPVLIITLGCLVAVTAPVVRADVYQCTRNGQVTFSDIPCSSDAKPLPLNIYTPSPEEVERATRQTRETGIPLVRAAGPSAPTATVIPWWRSRAVSAPVTLTRRTADQQ